MARVTDPLSLMGATFRHVEHAGRLPIEVTGARPLKALEWEVLVDGEVRGQGEEGEARLDPLGVLQAVANDLASNGMGLEAGQAVTTGASATPTPATSGQTTVVRAIGVGEVVAILG